MGDDVPFGEAEPLPSPPADHDRPARPPAVERPNEAPPDPAFHVKPSDL